MMPSASVRRSKTGAVKTGVVMVMAFLLAAAAYTSVLIVHHQAALREVARYNLTWLVSQAALEVARLDGTIAAALVEDSGVNQDDIELRLDIVENRVQLFEGGEIADFVATSPEFCQIVAAFRSVVQKARAELEGPISRPGLLHVLRLVDGIQPQLARLAAAANSRGGDLVAGDQRQLSRLHWTFAGILGALTLCGFSLVGAMTWHNRLLAVAQDEAQQKNRVLELRDVELNTQNARFDAALNNMSHALCMIDVEQRLIVCNARFNEMFGLLPTQTQPGALVQDIFDAVAASGRYGRAMLSRISSRQLAQAGARASCNFVEQDNIGTALAIAQEPLAEGGWVSTFEDITERRRTEQRINHMAHHDALTDLPNRLSFHKHLETALAQHASSSETVAMLCLDLDRFKEVNDTLGHPAGDTLLKAAATRLQCCVREQDLVVRLGGDEFAILQVGAKQPGSAEALAARVVKELGRPHEIEGHRVMVGTSIGIAIADATLHEADMLIKSADIALYRAKAEGRGRFRLFESAMDTEIQARRTIEADLREALGRGELEVFYQPLINLSRDRICGFEGLLRWRHPTRGMVSPGVFVPIAEELGLIVAIGEWVLDQACADAAAWPSNVKVAVNLSPVQFQDPGLVAAVQRALLRWQLPASRLELEITESALLQDSDTVLKMLHELGSLGVRIALDDFGTGYSSLSYLRSFPFSKLKIDQSFIKEIAYRTDCEAIVRAVNDLAGSLGMTTTAEGVETEDQLDRLRQVGCTEVQGFLFDRPRPLGEICRWFSPEHMGGSKPSPDLDMHTGQPYPRAPIPITSRVEPVPAA
jgi:diguanylate cyclase (GGDEF)-like protein